jgi:hypothetical protein
MQHPRTRYAAARSANSVETCTDRWLGRRICTIGAVHAHGEVMGIGIAVLASQPSSTLQRIANHEDVRAATEGNPKFLEIIDELASVDRHDLDCRFAWFVPILLAQGAERCAY